MESAGIPIDIIVYAIIAGALFVWLMRIIGTKSGTDRERPNPFAIRPDTKDDDKPGPAPDAATGKVITLPAPARIAGLPAEVDAGLVQIALSDRNFDAPRFIENAKDAFSMIVEAYADGDRPALKDLLGPGVYNSFDTAITAREQAGRKLATEVVAIREAKIIEARMEGTKAVIAIRFVADESYLETDATGKVVAGHAEKLVTMTDVWVFTRETRSNDPRWFVSETRDDVKEENAPTLPEAKG